MADHSIPDRFQILEELLHVEGEILLRARDSMLGREVILRRPTADLAQTWRDRDVAEGEMRSARALARVQHPNVVRLLEVIATPEGPLVVMEPVPGDTLAERIARDGLLTPAEVSTLAIALAGALEAVHAQGIVHRGISASSVVLRPDGSPCLSGFIFAKFDARAGTGVPGTTFFFDRKGGKKNTAQALPPHPAPEQVRGQAADARSDLFGLGWVLYEALTGESPYPRDLEPERWDAPPDPRKRSPNAPKGLAQAIVRCLATSPMKRYASATELRLALEAAAPAPAQTQASGGGKRKQLLVSAASVLVIGTLAAIWFSTQSKTALGGEVQRSTGDGGGTPLPLARGQLNNTYGKSYALLIGIGKGYSKSGFADLPNAESDVDAIEKKLRELPDWGNAEVRRIPGAEATRTRIKNELYALSNLPGPEDRVFIYYAGHGEKEVAEGYGYIIPIDGEPATKDVSHTSWLSFADSFGLFFGMVKAKHVLLAVDCCFGGRAISRGIGVEKVEYSNNFLTRRAHVIVSSGNKNETVLDGGGVHSPFAQAFLDALSRDREAVTTSTLFGEISQAYSDHGVQQMPTMGYGPKHEDSQFVFFTKEK